MESVLPADNLLVGFIAASLVVLLLPGPGVLYIVARSLSQGRRAGLVSVAGLSAGALLQVIAATVGLSALLLTSASAFNIVKWLGAAYLIYLGLRALLARAPGIDAGKPETEPLSRLFADGVIISLFNPKIAIFFLAYLPQFVDPGQDSASLQILLLGLIYLGLALFTDGAYALLAGSLRQYLNERLVRGPLPRYGNGIVFIGLGIGALLSERRT